MKIVFITPGMTYGGAERVISLLSNEWVNKGHSVELIITGDNRNIAYELSDKINVEFLSGLRKVKLPHLDFIRRIRAKVVSYSPDAAIAFMNDTCAYTALSLLGTNIPVFYSERNDPNKVNQRIIDKLYRRIVECSVKGIVFQTDGARACYSQKLQKKSIVILNPINTDHIPQWKYTETRKEVVSVGRLNPQKNQKLLIDAFKIFNKRYPEYVLKIYGSGELKDDLISYTKKNNLMDSVKFMGNSSDVLNEIKTASLFVLSSDYEGLPNALIEAMVMGMPCISTDCSPGGARMLIESGVNGIITPCGNSEVLAKEMMNAVADEKHSIILGENAAGLKQNVSIENIANKWIRFLERKTRNGK